MNTNNSFKSPLAKWVNFLMKELPKINPDYTVAKVYTGHDVSKWISFNRVVNFAYRCLDEEYSIMYKDQLSLSLNSFEVDMRFWNEPNLIISAFADAFTKHYYKFFPLDREYIASVIKYFEGKGIIIHFNNY